MSSQPSPSSSYFFFLQGTTINVAQIGETSLNLTTLSKLNRKQQDSVSFDAKIDGRVRFGEDIPVWIKIVNHNKILPKHYFEVLQSCCAPLDKRISKNSQLPQNPMNFQIPLNNTSNHHTNQNPHLLPANPSHSPPSLPSPNTLSKTTQNYPNQSFFLPSLPPLF